MKRLTHLVTTTNRAEEKITSVCIQFIHFRQYEITFYKKKYYLLNISALIVCD